MVSSIISKDIAKRRSNFHTAAVVPKTNANECYSRSTPIEKKVQDVCPQGSKEKTNLQVIQIVSLRARASLWHIRQLILFLAAGFVRGRHGNSLTASIGLLEELAQATFTFHEGLLGRSFGHFDDWSPQVELVCDVGADGTHE